MILESQWTICTYFWLETTIRRSWFLLIVIKNALIIFRWIAILLVVLHSIPHYRSLAFVPNSHCYHVRSLPSRYYSSCEVNRIIEENWSSKIELKKERLFLLVLSVLMLTCKIKFKWSEFSSLKIEREEFKRLFEVTYE